MPLVLVMPVAAHALVLSDTTSASDVSIESVRGRVTDANGAALPGAEIRSATGQRAVTGENGEFAMTGLPDGAATLTISYLGLPETTRTVSVANGETTRVDITLGGGTEDGGTTLEDVVVFGAITDGVARSLNQQRSSDATINVLSADAIGRYPDPNVAESLQRVQGVAIQRDQGEGRYINVRGAPSAFTAVSVDGVTVPAMNPDTRAVDLDTLPSDIVSSVEVSKTLLPRQDADSIAGAVNINTRSPFSTRGFALSGHVGGSYNDYGGHDTRAGLTVSNVFGPDQTVGGLLSLSFSETNRRPSNLENAWTYDSGQGVYVIEETLFKNYQTQRTRQAVTAGLEWRPNEDFRAWLRGSYAQFEDDEYRNTLMFALGDGTLQAGATDSAATFSNVRLYRQLRHRTQNNEITTLVAGGKRYLDNGGEWSFDLSWANSEQTYPNRNEIVFRTGNRTVSYDAANHYAPTYSVFTDPTGYYLDPANYSFRENSFRSNTTQQEDVAVRTDLELPTDFGGREVTWGFGLKYATRDVSADEERSRSRSAADSPGTLASLLTTEEARNFDYFLGYRIDPTLADPYFDAYRASSPRRMPDSLTADYQAQEDILAGYGQASFDVGATHVILGLRVEQTRFDGSALSVVDYDASDPSTVTPVSVSRDDTHVFPNLTVRHAFSDNLIGRFALTRSISRPEFNQIVPRHVEETDGTDISYEIGNPDLQPALSNNLDAGLEYYFASLGVASVNAFYKDLSDYRYVLNYEDTVVIGATTYDAQYAMPINAPDGHLAGIELNWQQKFTSLPGWASGFGVFANYTWTDAEITTAQAYGGRTTFALPGQSDRNYNLAVFYENAGFSARLSYTSRSDYLEEINADNEGLDLWVEGRDQLDFTTSYDFGNGIEVFAEAKNLTDSAGVRYYGERERTYEYEKFGYNLFAGLRFKF